MTAPPACLFYDPVSGQTFLTGPGMEYVPLAKLSDPVAVHLNMLRGTIAKPSIAQIAHIYGDEWTAARDAAREDGVAEGLRMAVGPLEWESRSADHWKAPTAFGTYYLENDKHGLLHLWMPYTPGKLRVESVAAGKAEAQRDFADRVLAALIPAPCEGGEG